MFVDATGTRYFGESSAEITRGAEADTVIGLVNIMPQAAMRTTEALFRRLLDAFPAPHNIHLRLFTLQEGPVYEGLNALWDSPNSETPLDALIVTGTESRARAMADEPCWPDLQKICDWAGQNTISTIWSCLSAHAAVLHMDNIHRQPFPEKLTGIFECEKNASHPIFKDMPARWPVPHSRYNNLSEIELETNGYEILSRSASVGADSFIKQHKNSQFLFLQGHLEYGPEMLLSEYCRDLKRFALGQNSVFPAVPQNYFDQAALEALTIAQKSMQSSPDTLTSKGFLDAVTAGLSHYWQAPAQQLFTAWLSFVIEQKTNRDREATLLPAQFAA